MRPQYPLLQSFYALLLRLYPRRFRDEFATDMQSDFADALQAAAAAGGFAVILFFVREGLAVLLTALAERWRANPWTADPAPRLGRIGFGFAVIPFIVTALIALSNGYRLFLPQWFGFTLLAFFGLATLWGFARGLPDWGLPYFGLCLGIAGLFFANSIYFLLIHLYHLSTDPLWDTILNEGVMWWGWLATLPLWLGLSALVPALRPFYKRVRRDWSVLSFAMLGTVPVALMISFDEYIGEEWFLTAISVVLVLAVYLYLHSPAHTRRVVALALGISLCVAIVIFAKWLLLPYQRWGDVAVPPSPETFPQEMIRALAMWGWMMLMIFGAPAGLDRLLGFLLPERAAYSQSNTGGTG